ncbi:MAG: hypothetical protein IJ619_06250 [Eubacterium sp.]|nr:hypothetical protein [Eubacterium sp.]
MIGIETFYLIDYENVHEDGLSGCQNLGETDHIFIFFTQNAKNIDMSDISNHGTAVLDMIEVPAGKQSADMHIGSYLGYLAGKNGKNCRVIIVSKDTDFDNVIKFWNQKTGISASRTEKIKNKSVPKPQTINQQKVVANKPVIKVNGSRKTKLNQEVMQAVSSAGYDASEANKVAQIAAGLYGDDRMLSEVHNALSNKYSDYLDIYAAIKPVLSKYADDNQLKNGENTVSSKDKTTTNSEIQKVLSIAGFSNDVINYVASTVVKNLGVKNGKQQTYRTIIAKYGQSKGLNIYNHIKKYI